MEIKIKTKGEQNMDLSKFSKEDLKKTAGEISEYLKKVDEKDYDPNQSTPDAAHLEDKLGGTHKKIEDKGGETTEKSVETKKDFPGEGGKPGGDEDMTPPSQGDMQAQILAMLKEILGKLSAPPVPPAPAPTDQIQHAETPPTPVATPATAASTTKTPEKGDININVTKSMVEEVLKGMGITPSSETPKPKQDTGHPIEKGNSMTYEKIKKMSWDELYNYDQEVNPRTF